MAIRRTELTITFECDYMVSGEGEITGLLILDGDGVVNGRNLLDIDSVRADLEADHQNQVKEDNCDN